MLPNLRRAEGMRHLCDEAVDEAPPSLLVRCIMPLFYRPLATKPAGEETRMEGGERVFRVASAARRGEAKETDRPSRQRSEERRVSGKSKVESDSEKRRKTQIKAKRVIGNGGDAAARRRRRLLCQASMSKAASVPASVGSIVSEDEGRRRGCKTQSRRIQGQRSESVMGDGVQERGKARAAREKTRR